MTERTPAPWQAPPWLRRGIVFALVAVAAYQIAVWAFQSLSSFLGLLFLSWLFAISMEPVVGRLARRGMRRGLATGLVMLGVVGLVAAFLAVFGALLVDQLGQLIRALPDAVRSVVGWANDTFDTDFRPGDIVESLNLTPERIGSLAQDLTPGLVGFLTALIGTLFEGFTLLLFAYFMSAEGPTLRDTLARRFPPRQQRVITTVWTIAIEKTGGYVVSRLLLAAASALFTGAFLAILDVPYWLPLAIWTGLVSQFIPTIGTYLAIVLPALIALASDPSDALWVVGLATVYQQIENYFLMPRITSRTVEIHPAVAFGAVIVGASLFGPLGGLVAIPVVAAVQAVIETYGHRYELVDAADGPDRADGADGPDAEEAADGGDGARVR